jgi:hypothetical protein
MNNKRKIRDVSQPNQHGVDREREPVSSDRRKKARAQSPQGRRPPMDRPVHAVRVTAFANMIPPLASSVSKAGGGSTSSAKDSRSTVLVLPPQTAAYYSRQDTPHSRKSKPAVKEQAAPSGTPDSSTLLEPEQRDLVVSAPSAEMQTPSRHSLSVGIDYTDRFTVPESPDHPETGGTVTYNGKLINLDEDLDMIGSEDELLDTLETLDELEALDALELMEIEALKETPSEMEPEPGGTTTPAPEADLEVTPMASASPAHAN